jgi:hypothetical protein
MLHRNSGRERRFRAAFVFVLAFGTFSAWQYVHIDREMQQKLENQSYVLSEYAASEPAGGDYEECGEARSV